MHKFASRTGTLLMRNDRKMKVVWDFSLWDVAFARTSKAANMRSMMLVCMST